MPHLNRRSFVTRTLATATGTFYIGGIGLHQASAETTAVAQAPGYYRFNIGVFKCLSLSDGYLTLPSRLLARDVPEDLFKKFLRQNYLPTDENISQTNITLVDTGEKRVLFDVGSGPNFQDSAGKLSDLLEIIGIEPDQIDAVIITHAHPDHIWGLIDEFEEAPRFANAHYYINAVEFDFWTASDVLTKLAKPFHPFALGAQRNLKPLSEKMTFIKPGEEIMPGFQIIDSRGHTPGHVSCLVTSNDETLLVTGDALTHFAASFQHPEWMPVTDYEGPLAVTTRKRILDMAATDRLRVIGYHLPFPGVGHVARKDGAYRWVPDGWNWSL